MILNHRGQPVEFPRLGFRPSAPTAPRVHPEVATVVATTGAKEPDATPNATPDAQLVDAVGYWSYEPPEMVAEIE